MHGRKRAALRTALFAAAASLASGGQARADVDFERAKAMFSEGKAQYEAGDKGGGLAKMAEAAIAIGNTEIVHSLGHAYQRETSVPNHMAEAVRLFKVAAERGHSESAAHYGEALVEGEVVERDHRGGVELLMAAYSMGYQPAYTVLERIAEKQLAAIECALGEAKRLGYQPDETQQMVTGRASQWHIVRAGAGAESRGDVLSIYGADDDGAFGVDRRFEELKVSARGFTGMRVKSYSAGSLGSLNLGEITGDAPASEQGVRDMQAILSACGG